MPDPSRTIESCNSQIKDGQLFHKFDCNNNIHHADDTQLYNRLSLKDHAVCHQQVNCMEQCIEDVRGWMTANRLKLNEAKTEVIIITSKNNSHCVKDINIMIGEESISPKPSAKNLGAVIDSNLMMERQVNSVTSSMYHYIRCIAKVKHQLTKEACAQAINTTVLSRLDYHNGLLLGAPEKLVHKLQVAQNSAARLLTGTSRREHITPVLKHLHWLPVRQRITFKVLTNIQKSLHSETAPQYMRELCPVHQPRRTLRSSADHWRVEVSRSRNQYGARSISTLGAQLWNELPINIRGPISRATFRKHLKTILFKQAYN